MSLLCRAVSAHDETRLSAEQRRVEIERQALAQADPTVEKLKDEDAATVTLKLVDDADGSPLPSLVRVTNVDDGKAIRLPNEIHRAANWFSLDAEIKLRLPRRKLKIEAIHGLETERAERVVDLSSGEATTAELRLRRFYDAKKLGLRAGNTHLHLRGISIAEMDRYLRLVPQTDGLELVFVSHLRRASEDRDYTSNVLTTADLARLSTPNVQFGNGEEHRHNFGAGGQGYGHVMFLNIQKLIQPVSIGPGIMQEGTDGRPLREGHRCRAGRRGDGHLVSQPFRPRRRSQLACRSTARPEHPRRRPNARQLRRDVLPLPEPRPPRAVFDRHRLVHLRLLARLCAVRRRVDAAIVAQAT